MTKETSSRRARTVTTSKSAVPSVPGGLAESGSVREALEVTLSELHRLGRIEKIDTAAVQVLRSMANVLDEAPRSPQMWQQFRIALEELVRTDDGPDLDDLIADLHSETRDT